MIPRECRSVAAVIAVCKYSIHERAITLTRHCAEHLKGHLQDVTGRKRGKAIKPPDHVLEGGMADLEDDAMEAVVCTATHYLCKKASPREYNAEWNARSRTLHEDRILPPALNRSAAPGGCLQEDLRRDAIA